MEHYFLSPEACIRLRHKTRPHLQASLVTRDQENTRTSAATVHADSRRTSKMPMWSNGNSHSPSAHRRPDAMSQPGQILFGNGTNLHYAPGQAFLPHTEVWDGRGVTAYGMEHFVAKRLVTLVGSWNQGETHFYVPHVVVTPRPGRVVVHFPSAASGRPEVSTTTVH